MTQSRRFDPDGKFIRRYLPQLERLGDDIHAPWEASPIELEAAGVELGRNYPRPIVDHAEAREKTLRRYAVVKERADLSPALRDAALAQTVPGPARCSGRPG